MTRHLALLIFISMSVTTAAEDLTLELNEAPEGTFSIAVIPDTQHYRRLKTDEQAWENPTFEAYTDWIAANFERQRIVFVSHVGDIVDLNERSQWSVAKKCMDKLHGRVPYGISVGNHDMVRSGDSTLFQEFFPKSRFAEFDWYGGTFGGLSETADTVSGNNANSFQLFSAEGMDFVFLHLECNAPDDVLDWATDVLTKHSDRRAIITTHMGLGPRDRPQNAEDYFDAPKGRMTWKKCHGERGNTPQQMWDKCFSQHSNVFIVCCGDQSRTQAMHSSSQGVQGNTVHELLSDYGVSGLRVMRFVPKADRIEVRTWNPLTGKLTESTKIVPDAAQHQFDLPYAMTNHVSEQLPAGRGPVSSRAADPIPIAHRGLLRHAPENTLPAFAACMELGMGFELDIRTTKDGHLVIVHDDSVQRTTNGDSRSVRDLTLAELKQLDAGSWFDHVFSGERIPTLEETLSLVARRKRGRTIIALNVKHVTREGEATLVGLVEKYELLNDSFAFDQSDEMSRRLKTLNPNFRIGQNVKRENIDSRLEEGLLDCFLLTATPTVEEVSRLRRHGKKVLFNYAGSGEARRNSETWKRAAAAGIDGMLTDYPLECRAVWRAEQHSEFQPKERDEK